MDLFEDGVEVGRKGIEDVGAQGLGDLVNVMEQLGSSALGLVLQVDQASVEGAQLLVWLQRCFARGMELSVGVFAIPKRQLTADDK